MNDTPTVELTDKQTLFFFSEAIPKTAVQAMEEAFSSANQSFDFDGESFLMKWASINYNLGIACERMRTHCNAHNTTLTLDIMEHTIQEITLAQLPDGKPLRESKTSIVGDMEAILKTALRSARIYNGHTPGESQKDR